MTAWSSIAFRYAVSNSEFMHLHCMTCYLICRARRLKSLQRMNRWMVNLSSMINLVKKAMSEIEDKEESKALEAVFT